MGCLYSLQSPSGKRYIGISSKSLEDRWAKHVEHAMGKRTAGAIYAALRKYGPENFKRETLVVGDFDYLKELEVKAISAFGTFHPNGYNLTLGGEGTTGKRNPEQIEKHRQAQIRRYKNPEQRQKAKELFAKWRDENPEAYLAAREKQKTATRKTKKTRAPKPKVIDYRSHSQRTKDAMNRPEVREKVLACAKARASDPNWRAKVAASKMGQGLGKKHSEEWVSAQVAGIKAAWADPEKRAKRLEKLRLAKQNKGTVMKHPDDHSAQAASARRGECENRAPLMKRGSHETR